MQVWRKTQLLWNLVQQRLEKKNTFCFSVFALSRRVVLNLKCADHETLFVSIPRGIPSTRPKKKTTRFFSFSRGATQVSRNFQVWSKLAKAVAVMQTPGSLWRPGWDCGRGDDAHVDSPVYNKGSDAWWHAAKCLWVGRPLRHRWPHQSAGAHLNRWEQQLSGLERPRCSCSHRFLSQAEEGKIHRRLHVQNETHAFSDALAGLVLGW